MKTLVRSISDYDIRAQGGTSRVRLGRGKEDTIKREGKINSLRKLQIHHLASRAGLEQIPIMRRLLDHARVQCIPVRPTFLIACELIDDACEERLGGIGGAAVRGAGEFVESEAEGEGREGEVETALCAGRVTFLERGWMGRSGFISKEERRGRTPKDSSTGSGWGAWCVGSCLPASA